MAMAQLPGPVAAFLACHTQESALLKLQALKHIDRDDLETERRGLHPEWKLKQHDTVRLFVSAKAGEQKGKQASLKRKAGKAQPDELTPRQKWNATVCDRSTLLS
jgi:hypothetical protein